MNKREKFLLIPDLHCDDHDERAVSLAIQICEAYRPDTLIFLGDFLDSGWASTYPQNLAEIPGQLERELTVWESIHPHFKAPRRLFLKGNHEHRIERFLWANPALAGFRGFSDRELFRLKPTDKLIREGYIPLAEGSFIVTHGKVVRRWSCYSAKDEMQMWGTSGASGHTHRLGTYYHRDATGVRSWTESGHLSNNPPRYSPPNQPGACNWQQGVVTLSMGGNDFHVECIPFTLRYHAMLGGKRYSA